MSAPAAYTPPIDQPLPVTAAPQSLYGGFWIRLAAYFVDGLIIWLCTLVIVVALAFAAGLNSADTINNLVTLVLAVGGQLYHAYFISSARMATPGKRLCGLYVTDLAGQRLGFGHALGRNLAAFFSYITLYIGFIMIAFTERKQAMHDKMAGTLVHRQPGSSKGVVIAICLVIFFFVVIVGILAAVAVSSFQEYGVRARMSGVYGAMSAAKTPIAEYAANKGAWPETWEQVESAGGTNPKNQLPASSRELVLDILLGQAGEMVAIVTTQGKPGKLRLTPRKIGDKVEWTCSADPDIRKFVPPNCRQ